MRQLLLSVAVGLTAPLLPAAVAGQDADRSVHVFIAYQTEPAQRTQFRDLAAGVLASRFDAWRAEGVYADYMLLYNTYTDADTWDLLLILRFDDYAQVARWNHIERGAPGGLTPEALRIATPRHTYLANRVWDRAAPDRDPACAVYFVFPYDYSDEGVYRRFAETYVVPQMDAWVDAGVVARYSLFLNRHPTGKPWGVLSLLEYADHERFGRRDDIKQEIRAGLDGSAAWRLAGDIKSQFRQGRQPVVAEPIGAQAAGCSSR
jgi:hypothetical protein